MSVPAVLSGFIIPESVSQQIFSPYGEPSSGLGPGGIGSVRSNLQCGWIEGTYS